MDFQKFAPTTQKRSKQVNRKRVIIDSDDDDGGSKKMKTTSGVDDRMDQGINFESSNDIDERTQRMILNLLKGRSTTVANQNQHEETQGTSNSMAEINPLVHLSSSADLDNSNEDNEALEETDEEDFARIFEEEKAEFPSDKEVKLTEIYPISYLTKDVVYFILKGQLSKASFVNEDGKVENDESIVINVIATSAESVDERIKVRLTGIPYKKLVSESQYFKFKDTDNYFLLYKGKKESSATGYMYNQIKVLHRQKGEKQFRVDPIPNVKKNRELIH